MGSNMQAGRRAVLRGIGALGAGAVLPRIAAAARVETATLYEEDPDNPKGVTVAASAVWRFMQMAA